MFWRLINVNYVTIMKKSLSLLLFQKESDNQRGNIHSTQNDQRDSLVVYFCYQRGAYHCQSTRYIAYAIACSQKGAVEKVQMYHIYGPETKAYKEFQDQYKNCIYYCIESIPTKY